MDTRGESCDGARSIFLKMGARNSNGRAQLRFVVRSSCGFDGLILDVYVEIVQIKIIKLHRNV